ncbi:hypothetical protein HRbin36_02115 [bacterium HR36]|nr:hypothetical protein HRbin36_02115 [bacterium HR36]
MSFMRRHLSGHPAIRRHHPNVPQVAQCYPFAIWRNIWRARKACGVRQRFVFSRRTPYPHQQDRDYVQRQPAHGHGSSPALAFRAWPDPQPCARLISRDRPLS